MTAQSTSTASTTASEFASTSTAAAAAAFDRNPQNEIAAVTITPVAFKDPPLLNTVGVHEPYALRAIVQVTTRSGLTGLGETYGDAPHLHRLALAADAVVGINVFDTNRLRFAVAQALAADTSQGGHGMSGMVTGSSTADRVLSPFDVAALDLQGKILGVPVSSLLGGAIRPEVAFSGYLFYKWAGHPGAGADEFGEALSPEGIVEQARQLVDGYGFSALKLKGGVFEPDQEIAAILALADAFPDLGLRLDPNAAWSVETSLRVAKALESSLEYLEDPTPGLAGMAEVRRGTTLPLATNMCVVSFADVKPAVEQGSIDIVLSDHHFWGGLTRSRTLGGLAESLDWGLSMHSNSHLGISLAAMVHLASATPSLSYACDTHWPWKQPDEDVVTHDLSFVDGSVLVPTGPGLGVELDEDGLAKLHEQFLDSGITQRDDTGYMQRFQPGYTVASPRW
ncbi:enolase C-terminal domain-like protein [Pseudoclavibacter sp. RFBB5]|uniref:enolase C-terminal domain-like protein n=1 Tax=Pseudoclavibacter sp. RFBB5 TaxID=2080574 RepID=UPI000CE8C554|nr:enolase C-terminal domain-like protein [Pseudoclavibacter sp. RFBB5]PPG29079.1 glucarate dehydratase [Pseudoclavibacter sp. RFBB5]